MISGIVSAPEGYDVEGTEIQACIDADCFTVTITDTGREAPFTIEDLPEGDYTLAAFKPMGEDSFLAGCHGTGDGITCTGTPVSPPRQDVDIDMQLVEIAAPPEPPPAEE